MGVLGSHLGFVYGSFEAKRVNKGMFSYFNNKAGRSYGVIWGLSVVCLRSKGSTRACFLTSTIRLGSFGQPLQIYFVLSCFLSIGFVANIQSEKLLALS